MVHYCFISSFVLQRPQSGLLAQISPEESTENDGEKDKSLMQPIDCPSDVIGEGSAAGSFNALSNAHQKLNLIYNQLKTSASFSKYDKSPLNCKFQVFFLK